mmetsp:Transcript_5487/g.7185  ORF Transcript_5487/g.7185 Transcript_5487/m.7185 type:complete len:121 (+) Transcript_5487:135-497(+)
MLMLDAHNTTSPVSPVLLIPVVEVGLDCLYQLSKLVLVLILDVGEGYSGSCLLVHQLAKASLALYYAVWYIHLSAERWQENDELNRINIMSDDNKLSLLLLNQSSNVVDAVLKNERLLEG